MAACQRFHRHTLPGWSRSYRSERADNLVRRSLREQKGLAL